MFDSTKGKKVSLKALKKRQQAEQSDECGPAQEISQEMLLEGFDESQASGEQSSDSDKIWVDGTESEMFNKLEQIAKSSLPKTPVLDATITRSLEPINVSDDVSVFCPNDSNNETNLALLFQVHDVENKLGGSEFRRGLLAYHACLHELAD